MLIYKCEIEEKQRAYEPEEKKILQGSHCEKKRDKIYHFWVAAQK